MNKICRCLIALTLALSAGQPLLAQYYGARPQPYSYYGTYSPVRYPYGAMAGYRYPAAASPYYGRLPFPSRQAPKKAAVHLNVGQFPFKPAATSRETPPPVRKHTSEYGPVAQDGGHALVETIDDPITLPPAPAVAEACPDCHLPPVVVPVKKGCCHFHIFGFGEFLYLNVRDVDVPFGQPFDGVTPLSVPRGRVGVADTGYSRGYRAGIGVKLSPYSVAQASLTQYRTESRDSLTAPAGTAIRPFLIHPATFNAAFTPLDAVSDYEIDYRAVDVEFKHALVCNPYFKLYYLLGARYAELEQSLQVDYIVLDTTTVETDIDFFGGGVRGGLEAEACLPWGLFSYGKGAVNVLAGRFDADYKQTNSLTGLQAESGISVERVVPIVDLEVGFGWQSKGGHVRVSAGYSFSRWFYAVTTPSFIQAVRNTNYTTNADNFRDVLTFDGVVGRLEVRY